jgi:hypothetical protein
MKTMPPGNENPYQEHQVCTCCADLTLENLVRSRESEEGVFFWDRLAKGEIGSDAYQLPSRDYFRHHISWAALEESALGGCQFCVVIREEFLRSGDDNRTRIDELIATGSPTDIRVGIDSLPRVIPVTQALNHLIFQVGGEVWFGIRNRAARIAFCLIKPRGETDISKRHKASAYANVITRFIYFSR